MQDYNDLIINNLLKEFYTTNCPRLKISRQWFFRIKKTHTIILKAAKECLNKNNRIVYFEVDHIGSNVKYVEKDNICVLNPSTTLLNIIFITVWLGDLYVIRKLQFYTQLGYMIQKYNLNKYKD